MADVDADYRNFIDQERKLPNREGKLPWRYQFALDRIKERFGEKKVSVLDIGCADGIFVEHLIKLGYSAFGIDRSEQARSDFQKRTGRYCYKSIEEFRAKHTCDVITCIETLEHNPKDEVDKIISDMKSLNPKLVIITVPMEKALADPFHKSFFTYYDLMRIGEEFKMKDYGIYLLSKFGKKANPLNMYGLVVESFK